MIRVEAPGDVEVFLDGRPVVGSTAVDGRGTASATSDLPLLVGRARGPL